MKRARNFIDLTSQRFGKLLVVSLHDRAANGLRWLCVCDCGNQKIVSGPHLRAGHTKSCGCLQGLPLEGNERGCRAVYQNYKNNARQRGHVFALDREQVKSLNKAPCCYCGSPPGQVWVGLAKQAQPYFYNGIDRVDPARGYEPDNVVSCCGTCNVAKNDMSYQEFVEWINKVHNHLGAQNESGHSEVP